MKSVEMKVKKSLMSNECIYHALREMFKEYSSLWKSNNTDMRNLNRSKCSFYLANEETMKGLTQIP